MNIRAMALTAALLATASLPKLASAQNSAVLQNRGPIWVTVPTSPASLETITAKAPANGYFIVTTTGSFIYEHNGGTQGWFCLTLSPTAGNVGACVPNAGSDSGVRGDISAAEPSTVPGFGATTPYSIVRTYPVIAGDAYTFHLNGDATGFTAAFLFQPSITVLYVPNLLAQ
jgi:hypothetical protein